MGLKRIVIHIDRLALKGFRDQDRVAIAAGLQDELARVLGDRADVRRLSTTADALRLQVGSVPVERGSRPRRVGQVVARGIGKEMTK